LTLDAVEQLLVPVILHPFFSQRLRASKESELPRLHWLQADPEAQLAHFSA